MHDGNLKSLLGQVRHQNLGEPKGAQPLQHQGDVLGKQIVVEVRAPAKAERRLAGPLAKLPRLLKPCLPEGFAEKRQRISAYRLMALTYVATDSLEQARTWVRQLLKADSRFAPDPQVDPLLFTDLVRDLKPKWYTLLWKGNAWYKWVGRGVVVGGLVSLPLLLRDNTPPDLPGHPGLPQ